MNNTNPHTMKSSCPKKWAVRHYETNILQASQQAGRRVRRSAPTSETIVRGRKAEHTEGRGEGSDGEACTHKVLLSTKQFRNLCYLGTCMLTGWGGGIYIWTRATGHYHRPSGLLQPDLASGLIHRTQEAVRKDLPRCLRGPPQHSWHQVCPDALKHWLDR